MALLFNRKRGNQGVSREHADGVGGLRTCEYVSEQGVEDKIPTWQFSSPVTLTGRRESLSRSTGMDSHKIAINKSVHPLNLLTPLWKYQLENLYWEQSLNILRHPINEVL